MRDFSQLIGWGHGPSGPMVNTPRVGVKGLSSSTLRENPSYLPAVRKLDKKSMLSQRNFAMMRFAF